MDATFQLSPFLQFLRPPKDETDEEDEDDDEEEEEAAGRIVNAGVKAAKTRF